MGIEKLWNLKYDDTDVLIVGPGHLEMVLRDFDPTRVMRHTGVDTEPRDTLRQQTWSYPVEDGLTLTLTSTWDSAHLVPRVQHLLHVNACISWSLRPDIAEAIHAL